MPEKGSSSSAKAARSTVLEVKQEPHTMAEKKKRKSEQQSPPKVPPKKSEAEMPKKKQAKAKVSRGNVSFAIAGKGPQKSISAAPTRGEKFQLEGGYDRDVDTMQKILEEDFSASLGRLVVHYKDCWSEEPKSMQEIGLAVLLHTSVEPPSVQSVLRCRTKNAQSAAAAREYFEKRYPSSSLRQVAEGILKGLLVCTGCAAAPQRPVDLSPPSEGISLAKLKMEAREVVMEVAGPIGSSQWALKTLLTWKRMFCRCCTGPLLCFCNVVPRVMRVPRVPRVCF